MSISWESSNYPSRSCRKRRQQCQHYFYIYSCCEWTGFAGNKMEVHVHLIHLIKVQWSCWCAFTDLVDTTTIVTKPFSPYTMPACRTPARRNLPNHQIKSVLFHIFPFPFLSLLNQLFERGQPFPHSKTKSHPAPTSTTKMFAFQKLPKLLLKPWEKVFCHP